MNLVNKKALHPLKIHHGKCFYTAVLNYRIKMTYKPYFGGLILKQKAQYILDVIKC